MYNIGIVWKNHNYPIHLPPAYVVLVEDIDIYTSLVLELYKSIKKKET